MTNIFI